MNAPDPGGGRSTLLLPQALPRGRGVLRLVLACLAGPLASACRSEPEATRATPAPAADWFVDRAEAAGLRFAYFNGMSGHYYFPEMLGGGVALVDYDNDGDLDVLINVNNGPARLLRNDSDRSNHVLRVRTVGTASNRDGIGARVEVTAGGRRLWQIVKTGSSYASQSELPVTFGLGSASTVDAVRVTWPNGRVDTLGPQRANQVLAIVEGTGLSQSTPIARR